MRADLFTVVIDHFMIDTARHADIVLPATTQFEHVDVQGAWGHHYVLANLPAVSPMGEARSSGAIMRGLAAKLGLHHPAFRESDEEIAASVLPEGWSWAELAEAGWRKSPTPRPAIEPRSERLRLSDGPIEAPDEPDAGLLQLLTPKSHYFLNSTFANMPRHRQSQGAPAVTLNAADARRLSLSEGQTVKVTSGAGALQAVLKLSDGIRPGIASFEGKWWEEEGRRHMMNSLTRSLWSPGGQPAYNEVYVRVEAVTPG
jgi:anaerobic selenocysteine-containing dehydrogenase